MLGRRAVIGIIGIISGCSLLLLLIAWCIVYYRRYLRRKGHTYVTAAQADDGRINDNSQTEQTRSGNRLTDDTMPDSPPPTYAEATASENYPGARA